jgi:putative drug exporter of the RND superfamily
MNAVAWILVRLRLVVIAFWIAAAYLATTHLPSFMDRPSSTVGGLVPTHSESTRVERTGIAEFGTPLLSRVAVVQRDPRGLDGEQQERAFRRAVRIDRGRDPVMHTIAFALPISNVGRAFPSSSERGTTVITFLYFRPSASTGAQLALAHTYLHRIARAGDAPIGVTGTIPAREAEFSEIQHALPKLEVATIALVTLILLIAFRGFGAPLVTLAAAGISYLISVRVLTWVGDRLGVEIPQETEPVLVALLLGLTTDYAVFFLSATRKRLEAGEQRIEAVQHAARSVMPIVVVAGLIVTLGSASLVVGKLGFFRAFGPGMAVTVATTLLVTVTFVPATMAVFGRALFWPGLRRGARDADDVAALAPSKLATHRGLGLLLGVVAAVALAIAAAQSRSTALGLTLLRGLPANHEVKRAAQAAGYGFAPGIVSPTELLLQGNGLGMRHDELGRLQAALEAQAGVAGVVGVGNQPQRIHRPLFVNGAGTAARFAIVLDDDPLSSGAIHTLRDLEDKLPSLMRTAGLSGVKTGFAGDTALADDAVRAIHADIARVAAALLLVNFVLLALFLRALLAPLYLLAASVLALAAAIGIATWVFQDHFGHPDITYYVPFAAAVLLLSLGSDYNVFITGRIWQEAERRPLREAIRTAGPSASRTIAIAGITLAGSFALLALIPIRPMRELAVVMVAGVLVDSFVVRSILVPSLMATFGERSWWPNRPPRVKSEVATEAE